MPSEKSKTIKIVIIGDSRVGKTSLRKRYMGEGFRGTYTATLGVEFSSKKIQNKTVTIFDLAGDPNSKMLRQQYYNATHGIILVFDIANRKSFENLPTWIDEVTNNMDQLPKMFILGNKEDLRSETDDPVDVEEGYKYSKTLEQKFDTSVSFLATSALTGYNVDVAFNKLLAEIEHN